jgi:hypothetical protein
LAEFSNSLKIGAISLRLAVFLLPLILLRIGTFTYSDIFVGIAFCLLLANSKYFGLYKKSVSRVFLICSLFSIYFIAISFYSSIDPIESALGSLKLLFSVGILGVTVFLGVRILQDAYALILSYSCGGAVASISAIFSVNNFQSGDYIRSAGLAGHPVGLAITCGTCIALLVNLPYGRKDSVIRMFLLILNGIGIVKSIGLTGAFIACIGMLIGQLFSHGKLTSRLTKTLLILMFAMLIWISNFSEALRSRLSSIRNPSSGIRSESGSLSGSTIEIRWLSVKAGLDRIHSNPIFGNGFDVAGQVSIADIQTHNYWILMWQSGGFVAGLIAIYIGLLALRTLFLSYKFREINPYVRISAVSLGTTLLGGMLSPALYNRTFYFTLALGYATSISIKKRH